jgi:membrane-associated protease RseP (regulator of RpoE activity)
MEYGLPALLLVASIVTTTAIGARFMQNFHDGVPTVARDSDLWPWPWLLEHPRRFLLGWPFSSTLLAILLTHEFGHYFACRAHRIRVTLPWVLPAPTLSGTIGAVLQIRGRIPSRRALVDVGIYGPLAGYVASLAAVARGLRLSTTAPVQSAAMNGVPGDLLGFGGSLTLSLVHGVLATLHPGTPTFQQALRHPILVAGWVGLFITSINLMPAGQLDGGHILYAVSPRLHRALKFVVPAALLLGGFYFWVGWILWGLVLLIPAMRHPRVPVSQPLDRSRLILCAMALAIFALTFSAVPFADNSVREYLHWGNK